MLFADRDTEEKTGGRARFRKDEDVEVLFAGNKDGEDQEGEL